MKRVRIKFNGVHYITSMDAEVEASPVLTIKQAKIVDKIVKSSTGELTVHQDWTKDISFAQAGDLI